MEKRLERTDFPGSVVSIVKSTDTTEIETAVVVDHVLHVVAMGVAPEVECTGVYIACDRFTTGSAYWDSRIRQLIAAGSPAEMYLPHVDGEPAISILPITSTEDADYQRNAIIVIRRSREPQDQIDVIREACGLTTTETEVLRYIYKGLNTVGVARALGIANSTARTHLHHIFDKTSTSRQSELVYFVANYPKG
nr:LuxR C-terminal-related transcriptional regulator [Chelatococcus sp. YT9]